MNYTFPPGPKGLPFFGNALEFRRDPLGFFTQIERTYGAIATVSIRNFKMVLATRASSVRRILIENAHNFTNRQAYEGLVPLLGEGLLTIDGNFHTQQRRLVMPAFHRQRIESYEELMVNNTIQLMDTWHPGQQLDIAKQMQWLTLKIVAKALFDVNLQEESSRLGKAFIDTAEYLNRARNDSIRTLPINLPFTSYGHFVRAKAILDDTVYKIIRTHKQKDVDHGDMLSMLFQAQDADGKKLSETQIHDETMTFLAAGHATTANALSWTFYLLAEHPRVRQNLLEEIWDTIGDRPITTLDLDNMPYLEMVVKESMRLYPPAWALMRRATNDFELEDYHFPAGTFVALSPYITHRLPDYWSEPEQFWPERFGPEHKEPREAFAYFPFGAGPRTCIGMPFAMMEARIILATIMQKFTPVLAPGARIVPQPLITLRPRYGLPMILQESMKIARSNHRHSEVVKMV